MYTFELKNEIRSFPFFQKLWSSYLLFAKLHYKVAIFHKLNNPDLQLQGFDEQYFKCIYHIQYTRHFILYNYVNLWCNILDVNLKCLIVKAF